MRLQVGPEAAATPVMTRIIAFGAMSAPEVVSARTRLDRPVAARIW